MIQFDRAGLNLILFEVSAFSSLWPKLRIDFWRAAGLAVSGNNRVQVEGTNMLQGNTCSESPQRGCYASEHIQVVFPGEEHLRLSGVSSNPGRASKKSGRLPHGP